MKFNSARIREYVAGMKCGRRCLDTDSMASWFDCEVREVSSNSYRTSARYLESRRSENRIYHFIEDISGSRVWRVNIAVCNKAPDR